MAVRRSSFMLLAGLIAMALGVGGCDSTPADDHSANKPDSGPPARTEVERASQKLRPVTRQQIESLNIGMAWGDVQMMLHQPDFLTTDAGPYLRAKEGGIYWLQFEGGGIWLTRAIYFSRGLGRGEVVLPAQDRGKSVKIESVETAKPVRPR